MKLLRGVLAVVCVTAAVLVVSAGPANAGLVQSPMVTTSFDQSTIPLNGTTAVNVGVSNPNPATTLTGVNVTDPLPAGVVVITPFSGGFCGGTFVVTANSITITGLTLEPADSCALGVGIQGTTLGPKVNTATVTSTNGGGGTATATLVVGSPPTITKAFGTSPITPGSSTSLTFTLTNPNAAALTGAAFTDTLPAGLVASGGSNTCGGVLTVGPGSIGLSTGTIPASNNCTATVNVTGTTAGTKTNTTSALTTAEGLTGAPATASLVVQAPQPATLTKAFAPSTVAVGATTTLTFTLTNPNPAIPLTRVTFADPFPSGLAVAANPTVTNTCGGVPSVGPFALAVAYANARLPAGASCTFSVNVTASSAGVKNNTTTIVSSTPGGIGNPASASLTVTP